MKKITFNKNNKSGNLLHIETEGCVVNIRINLHNTGGAEVTSVEIIPDHNAEEQWVLNGTSYNSIIKPTMRHI